MNKLIVLALSIWLNAVTTVFGQYKPEHNSVYKTSWADGAIAAAGSGISYWGMNRMNDKEPLSDEYLNWVAENQQEAKMRIPKFDRWSAGNFDKGVSRLTDIPFYGSFALPLLFVANNETRSDFGQIGLLYLETMAVLGSFYTHTAASVNRHRPLVYNTNPANDDRTDIKATNSFFAGHTAATASATFFAAKVFNDYFPNNRAKPFVWAGAALIPAMVGYGRLEAGKHFLSDNLVGFTLGASIGILVPHLHKISNNKNFTLQPVTGPYDGLAFRYEF